MSDEKEFTVGDRVRVVAMPPYVKTAEPMPMLRPPDVIRLGEEGVILARRPGGYWSIRFKRGAFLLDSQYIESATEPVVETLPKSAAEADTTQGDTSSDEAISEPEEDSSHVIEEDTNLRL